MIGFFKPLFALAAIGTATGALAGPFDVYYEGALPGQQLTTATFSNYGIETFDTRDLGEHKNFTTDFGTGGLITGAYTNAQINTADQYGGADGTGQYAVSFNSYSVDLTTTIPHGTNFFGYWLSALDMNNFVSFFSGNKLLFTFKPQDVINAVNGNPDYYGNPNANITPKNTGEPYIFLSFSSNDRPFDRIVFDQAGSGGYESDNHTVGRFTGTGTGTKIVLTNSNTPGVVPEPATWAMFIAGFGFVGLASRRRKLAHVAA